MPRSCACARGATGASATTRPRADAERALETVRGPRRLRTVARVYFQLRSSPSARASGCAPQVRGAGQGPVREIADRATVGKILNNLLNFLLGKPEEAIEHLNESFKLLLEYGSEADAARAVNSLAQVHLRTGQVRPRRSRRARR